MARILLFWFGGLLALAGFALAQDTGSQDFTPGQIKTGGDVFARHCSPCHGMRMVKPEVGFNLREFPSDQRGRFVNSVIKGKNAMPPWDGLLKPDEIDALWAYVIAGERN
jgi:mono/diheme cytochrome c family protein